MCAPAVSVVLPAYNAEPYIGAAVESILSQTFTDFELLVIDDGSTDHTFDSVANFNDTRLIVLRNETNLGLVASLNRGISQANGEFLARMDADDRSAPNRLEVQVEWMRHDPRLGVLSSHYETFDEEHSILDTITLPLTDARVRFDLYSKTHCFCHPAVMMRRDALVSSGGYNGEWFPAEDRELWMRMLETWHGANVPLVLHYMRRHSGSISSQNMHRQAELVVQATAETLARRASPPDVDMRVQRAGWARGELSVAFGLAASANQESISQHLQRAVALDTETVLEGFEELLCDQVAAYMHYSGADVSGCQLLLTNVFDILPPSLLSLNAVRARMVSRVYAIAAYYYAQLGERKRSKDAARRALLVDHSQRRNRGLIKLALGVG